MTGAAACPRLLVAMSRPSEAHLRDVGELPMANPWLDVTHTPSTPASPHISTHLTNHNSCIQGSAGTATHPRCTHQDPSFILPTYSPHMFRSQPLAITTKNRVIPAASGGNTPPPHHTSPLPRSAVFGSLSPTFHYHPTRRETMPSNHPTMQASASEQSLFQCGSCRKKYKRLDHLARHVRSRKNFPGPMASLASPQSSTELERINLGS